MIVIQNPEPDAWAELTLRPSQSQSIDRQKVQDIFNAVKADGDAALIELTDRYDGHRLSKLVVSTKQPPKIDEELARAIKIAAKNIKTYHAAQQIDSRQIETSPGVECWSRAVGIDRVGLYIPGGTAPLFSTVLMLVIPAQLAKCQEITVVTPPDSSGHLDPVMHWTLDYLGVDQVCLVGGAQAIAALSLGTKSVPRVDKIFGPGNQWVTAAKELSTRYGCAIDMPAGPSEVLIIADQNAKPTFLAADLLSQAEHGPDSQVILLSDSQTLIEETMTELKIQLEDLPRRSITESSLQQSLAISLVDISTCVKWANLYAPEHLILNLVDADAYVDQIRNAGSVFVGPWSSESMGDYASGTNHTLPTAGFARNYSGVSLSSFQKRISYQRISKRGVVELGPAVAKMARAEKLEAHARSIDIRLKSLES